MLPASGRCWSNSVDHQSRVSLNIIWTLTSIDRREKVSLAYAYKIGSSSVGVSQRSLWQTARCISRFPMSWSRPSIQHKHYVRFYVLHIVYIYDIGIKNRIWNISYLKYVHNNLKLIWTIFLQLIQFRKGRCTPTPILDPPTKHIDMSCGLTLISLTNIFSLVSTNATMQNFAQLYSV